jgi:hypothetical protein
MGIRRRKMRNLLLNYKVQMSHWLYFFSLSMGIMSAVVIWSLWTFVSFLSSPMFVVQSNMDLELHSTLVGLANQILKVTAGLFLAYTILSFFLSLVMTHRIFGPLVPIKRYINELKSGNFDAQLILRKHDHMKDLAEELKSLAAVLKQKSRP